MVKWSNLSNGQISKECLAEWSLIPLVYFFYNIYKWPWQVSPYKIYNYI